MKDYDKGTVDSIYSVEQSDAGNTGNNHGNTMPKMKSRQPIRPALKKTNNSKSSSKNASPTFRKPQHGAYETPNKYELDGVGLTNSNFAHHHQS